MPSIQQNPTIDDQTASTPTGVTMRFEATTLPVADIERAKAFYRRLGWRLDIDFEPDATTPAVQLTPPGSPASIHFDRGRTATPPGSLQGLILVVDDIVAARNHLLGVGVDVTEIWHTEPGTGRSPGSEPQRRSYLSFAAFADPDGNKWVIQEITTRIPGRDWPIDIETLAQRLHETSERHGPFEAVAPPHNWWDWCAAYIHARGHASPDDASAAADIFMADVESVIPT